MSLVDESAGRVNQAHLPTKAEKQRIYTVRGKEHYSPPLFHHSPYFLDNKTKIIELTGRTRPTPAEIYSRIPVFKWLNVARKQTFRVNVLERPLLLHCLARHARCTTYVLRSVFNVVFDAHTRSGYVKM